MSSPSPDAAWSDPRFVLKRATRRPTVPLEAYAPVTLSAEERAKLVTAATHSRALQKDGVPEAAFVFGVMPRSGTNYLERLLLSHPDTCSAPDDLRELPAFPAADDLEAGFTAALTRFYDPNASVFAPYEWLAYALGGYLNTATAKCDSAAKLMLVKDPHVRRITLFDAVLPREKVMIVLRDGRYLVDSTLRTWPLKFMGRTFEDICLEWEAATRATLDYAEQAPKDRVRLVRYEDLVGDNLGEMTAICDWLGLDPAKLDGDALTSAPVLGSSTHSRSESGEVGWTPVAKTASFDPTGRALEWSDRQTACFERVCGATQKRAGYAV